MSKFEWEVLDYMSPKEYIRWCAFLRMEQSRTPTGGGGGKIAKFKSKLAGMGYYKHTGRGRQYWPLG